MRVPDHPTLIRRMLDARLKKLGGASPVLAAPLNAFTRRCGKPQCRRRRGGPLHSGQHLTFKGPGDKARPVYVPKGLLPEVRAWIAEHKRVKALLHEIHLPSLALVRTHVRHRRRRAGRP